MILDRLYRALLRLYPASFRAEYGRELVATFRRERRDTVGIFAVVALMATTIADVCVSAAARHWDILVQDLRYTGRTLRRAPGFAITAMLLVGLGVGANTAAFSVTDFVLLRPLPFADADRLVKVWERVPGYRYMEPSPANYRDWARMATVFSSIGASRPMSVNLVSDREPERLDGAGLTADVLPTLGVSPFIGRVFSAADDRDGAPGTVLLSYRLWQRTFGGEMNAVGRKVLLNDRPYTVIGVMPPEFHYPDRDVDLWTAAQFAPANFEDRRDNWLEVVARLKPGVTIEQARAEMDVVAARLRAQYPAENEHTDTSVVWLRDELSEQSRLMLLALSGAALCVLLIACANLANLLLARALARRQELAVRTALGAGRERLVRQLATESLVLAACGGVIGVAVAIVAVPLLARLVPAALPIAETPTVDLRVLLFAGMLTAVTGLAFGLLPAMRAASASTGVDLDGLREGARSGGGHKERLRSALVVAEIVASIVLLVSAGLLMRALWTLQSTDPGFRTGNMLTLKTLMPTPRYDSVAKRETFVTDVLSRVRTLPGVTHAGYISYLPMTMTGGIWPVSFNGEPSGARTDTNSASLRFVTPGFFATLGIPIVLGRDVSATDTAERPLVAVVSQSFVNRYWPGQNPIGRRFTFSFAEREIVGVVGNIRVRGVERRSEPQVYLPSKQTTDGARTGYNLKDLVVHFEGPPEREAAIAATLVPAIREIIRQADPTQPVSNVQLMSDLIVRQTASRRVQVRVIGAFAILAFGLAGIGIHGLLAFAVSQRSQEIGVRIALGAQPRDILTMVLRQGLMLTIAGVIPGALLAYAAGRAMQALLAGITPGDAPTFLSAIGLAVVMMIAGSLVPTLRALRIDPVAAMRVR